jgi:hypothetical protein
VRALHDEMGGLRRRSGPSAPPPPEVSPLAVLPPPGP